MFLKHLFLFDVEVMMTECAQERTRMFYEWQYSEDTVYCL